MNKPTIDAVVGRFAEYLRRNLAWGCLHIVLDDGNIEDDSVLFCKRFAIEQGDKEGAELADLLLQMSKTQRKKLPHAARDAMRSNAGGNQPPRTGD